MLMVESICRTGHSLATSRSCHGSSHAMHWSQEWGCCAASIQVLLTHTLPCCLEKVMSYHGKTLDCNQSEQAYSYYPSVVQYSCFSSLCFAFCMAEHAVVIVHAFRCALLDTMSSQRWQLATQLLSGMTFTVTFSTCVFCIHACMFACITNLCGHQS